MAVRRVRCCRGAVDPLLPETCVVRDIGELAVMKALAALGTFTSRTLNHRPSTRCAGPPRVPSMTDSLEVQVLYPA